MEIWAWYKLLWEILKKQEDKKWKSKLVKNGNWCYLLICFSFKIKKIKSVIYLPIYVLPKYTAY